MAVAKTTTYLRRMRLPLLAATIAMSFILLLDVFVFDPTSSRHAREDPQATQLAGKTLRAGGGGDSRQDEGKEGEWNDKEENDDDGDDDNEEDKLLFSQAAWDNVEEGEDWDSIFDSEAWSSLLHEGFVGANVKDEPPLPRYKKPVAVGPAFVPKDAAMGAKAAPEKVEPKKVISLGLALTPAAPPGLPSDVLRSKTKKKSKKGKKEPAVVPVKPAEIQPFPAMPEENKVYEWFDTSYKKSPTYSKAKEFVEDEALYKSCATSIVAARAWSETILALGPFRYFGRSKNPCWYPDNGGKFTCFPHFFLAGVAGPGTDDVMSKILIHPDVVGKKEHQYWWDVGRQSGKSWEDYCQGFQREAEDILLDINDHKSSTKIIGDSSGTYFSSPTGWERLSGNENCDEPRITLASHLRRLRIKGLILVVMPHPTRRLLAEYRQMSTGRENAQQFHDYVQHAISTYKTCFASYSIRQCAYNVTLANTVKLSLHEGMYSVYMEDWIRIHPPEQMLVVRFEDYVKNIVPTLETIYIFLGVPEIQPAELAMVADTMSPGFQELVKKHNVGNFLPETIRLLNEFYQPFLNRMGDIMADPIKFAWKDT